MVNSFDYCIIRFNLLCRLASRQPPPRPQSAMSLLSAAALLLMIVGSNFAYSTPRPEVTASKETKHLAQNS